MDWKPRKLLKFAASLVAGLLTFFTLRRWALLVASLRGPAPSSTPREPRTPTVLLLVPARNEARRIPALLHHLQHLTYPREKLKILIIDDASSDQTASIARAWADTHCRTACLSLPDPLGKAGALQHALNREPFGELVVVFDADERPQPDVVLALAEGFEDAQVGAVTGYRRPGNPVESPIASYAAIEALTHQWVTVLGKDRLKLQPPILGSNCAYRRAALEALGGFRAGLFLEDSDLTVRLFLRGWQTRYCPMAISTHDLPATFEAYFRQHSRWSSGFRQTGIRHGADILADRRASLAARLEVLAFSAGYFDRGAVALGMLLSALGTAPKALPFVLAGHLITPVFQAGAALLKSGFWPLLASRLAVLPIFYILDIAAAVTGLLNQAREARGVWR